jgi:3-mercaptopyruvate sulfurtransferase SseA
VAARPGRAKVSPTSPQHDGKEAAVEQVSESNRCSGEVLVKTTADQSAALARQGTGGQVLAGRQWLAEHLHDPLVRVVEVDVSPAADNDWHINGAVLWNVYGDLKDASYRTVGADALQRLVARSGIGPDSTVVFTYCTIGGRAATAWFVLTHLLGRDRVRVYDGSWAEWGLTPGAPATPS